MSTDNRLKPDRRDFSLKTLWYALSKGRRRQPRRQNERGNPHYVDIYEDHRLLLWACGIVGFCSIDALLTLQILDNGGIEINPVMAFLLGISVPFFFYVKYLATAGAVIFILFHVNYQVLGIPVRKIMPVLFFGYAGLIGYEWLLLSV